MLLLHQVGSVKIGEVVRYTITYTPSQDRILPSPEKLHLRIRNTCAVVLRGAFVHGPYQISVAAYPSTFSPNEKFLNPRRYGVPEFEPMVKAAGTWECELIVPDTIRQSAAAAAAATAGSGGRFGAGPERDHEAVSWIVEVSSQVIFSQSAAVGYEIVLARDRKSLDLSYGSGMNGSAQPGRVSDHQESVAAKDGHHPAHKKGVFSRAIALKVEDTAALWNSPRLPGWDDMGRQRIKERPAGDKPVESTVDKSEAPPKDEPERKTSKDGADLRTSKDGSERRSSKDGPERKKQKKVHLVVLTHGLHSNLGTDLLFMKESIDNAVKKAKVDAKERRARERQATRKARKTPQSPISDADNASQSIPESGEPCGGTEEESDDDDEEVIVRGYSGNATRTERGIKWLGKRLSRYILTMTYPDQPYLPPSSKHESSWTHTWAYGTSDERHGRVHPSKQTKTESQDRPFKVTSISFIGHSLGGLVQTYAVAYCQKHSPDFFNLIRPINFIALATPFLGLSNENPLYVKFALDSGLVGRTGQDLGLTWRAPTIARSGFDAIMSNLGDMAHKRVKGETQPESKPLLRILPTGPAHAALKKFRNRTIYSNVVNDGIVPLRTSCLLFLDWQGLGRVEKARRDAGLVGTAIGFGLAELMGTNQLSPRRPHLTVNDEQQLNSGPASPMLDNAHEVPQPSQDDILEDDRQSIRSASISSPFVEGGGQGAAGTNSGSLGGFFSNLFRSNDRTKSPTRPKHTHIYRTSQTIKADDSSLRIESTSASSRVTTGQELEDGSSDVSAPPRTTFFESAHDLINPKVPDIEYILDPAKRPRTIFHDRIYHPQDIPPPPLKKRPTGSLGLRRSFHRSQTGSSSPYPSLNHEDSLASAKDYDDTSNTNPDKGPNEVADGSNMRVEEKIARAYHRDLSWRKVLVKLEPDAHNNIIVRRMFANAYGWPVVHHLVDAHFSDSAAARLRDDEESGGERALDVDLPPDPHGKETKAEDKHIRPFPPGVADGERTASESREAEDAVPELPKTPGKVAAAHSHPQGKTSDSSPRSDPGRPSIDRVESVTWSERDWMDSDNDSDVEGTAAEPGKSKDKNQGRSSSPSMLGGSGSGWNWTEAIVGRRKGNGSPLPSPAKEDGTDQVGGNRGGEEGENGDAGAGAGAGVAAK